MLSRACLNALLVGAVAVAVAGCTSSAVDSIVVNPATQTLAVGQTAHLTATGTVGHGNHPSTSEDVTSMVTWSSSSASVASVSSAGVVTAVSAGSATISASMPGYGGLLSSTAAITVTGSTGGATGGEVVSLAVIPGTQVVASANQTSQFIAIGTTSPGATENVTNQVLWGSSSAQVATINSSGLASATGQGTATISAIFTNTDKSVAAGTSTFTVTGAVSEEITALTLSPTTQSLSATGQSSQFIALGTSGAGLELNVTSAPGISWSSSVSTVATVSPTGLVAGVNPGQCTVTAIFTNPDGSVASASAIINVTSSPAPEPLLSLTIIPSTITVGNLQDTGNFLAIGTYATSPNVRDLTNSVTWISSFPNSFPVNSNTNPTNPGDPGGVVTAFGNGTATIIAEASDPTTGSIQTATATFSCPLVLPNPPTTPGSCFEGSQASALLSTITVYNEGANATNWLITAPSATGTPNVIHCGPGWAGDGNSGGSVCVASYPVGSTVTLTAPAQAAVSFGGWSDNCTASPSSISPNPPTAAGPNTCTIVPNAPPYSAANPVPTNITVGAIFN